MSHVLAALQNHARLKPLAPALALPRQRVFSFRDLSETVEGMAKALDKALEGTPHSAPVAIALDNGPEWVVADLALMRLNRASVPLPPFFSNQQCSHALSDVGAGALLVDRSSGTGVPISAGEMSFYCAVRTPSEAKIPPRTAKITYTSGSTGTPKGVCLSLSHMEAVARSIVEALGPHYAGVHAAVLPLGVLLENVAGLYANILAGGCYCAAPQASLGFRSPGPSDVATLVSVLAHAGATSIIVVPDILAGMVDVMTRSGVRLPDLKFVAVGGVKVSLDLLAAARSVGLPVYEGYGLSECASVIALNLPQANRPGTVGRVLAHIDVSIAPDGEVVIAQSPFLGYVGAPAPTVCLLTGDFGYLDDDGYLTILGRKKSIIVSSQGRNIAPEWVEGELCMQPEIGRAVVFGEAQPHLSAIVTASSRVIDESLIARAIDRANARLPAYAQIRRWYVVPAFTPENGHLTGNGRICRTEILEAYSNLFGESQ